ncbi:MAG: GH3 auxin-responsive promoter family protein [Siphonobacter sp.]
MAVLGNLLKRSIGITGTVIRRRRVNGYKSQRKAFIKLLNKARYTSFGEAYHFEEIFSAALFRKDKHFYDLYKKYVPVHDYTKMYAEWWHLTKEGEKDVSWLGRVKFFALSSGTSESASKYIPVTKDMVKAMQRTSIRQIIALSEFKDLSDELFEKGYLMLGGSTDLKFSGRYFEGDLSGINASQIPFWFERFYKPGKEIARIRDWEEKLEEITKQAKDWDIGYVVGVPAWIQLLLERIIKHYHLKNIHEIWPNLEVFGWGGVSFEPYRAGFEKLLGKPITYIETYLASEGFIAYQSRPHAKGMQLALNQGIFFEFIPFTDENFNSDGEVKPHPHTLMIDEVEENVEYALLISTCSGAWRYLIGDTVRFTDKKRCEITITGRTKHYLSLCGEHLSVDNMNRAIELSSQELGISIPEFSVAGVPHDSTFAHHWYIGTDDAIDPERLRELIDENLKELNDDYAVERCHALRNVLITILPVQTFYDWMASKGKLGGQHKFPRVLRKMMIQDWENFLVTKGLSELASK